MTTATQALEGTYTEDGVHSVFGFSVIHNGISTFRGTLDDVSATLTAGSEGTSLEGAAKVESISIREPEQFRAHVLGEEFFDAENNPGGPFRSNSIDLGDDGDAVVEGELTIAGTTREVTAKGTWQRSDRRAGHRARRDRARGELRPPRLRVRLADGPAERRPGARLGRRPERPPRADQGRGGVAMRVLGISGSLRRDSHNTALLRAAAELLPPGAELVLFDRLAAIPPYDEDADVDPAPAAVAAFREEIDRADAVLVSTPEYNASIPGVLKNAIDWASRPFDDNPFRGKPVLVVGASTGLFGAVWAQAEVRKVLDHIGARVLDSELPVGSAADACDEDGSLRDPALAEALEGQLTELIGSARSELVAA